MDMWPATWVARPATAAAAARMEVTEGMANRSTYARGVGRGG